MVTITEEAKQTKDPETKTVDELEILNVNEDIKTFEGTKDNGEQFSYKYIEKDGVKYRIPVVVLRQIRDILKTEPERTEVKVKSRGEGRQKIYFVE